MTSAVESAHVQGAPPGGQVRELTWQSVVGAFLISSLVAGSYPYVVLKLGMGPNVGVVSAFLGAIFLNIAARATRGRNRYLNNIIQTAGTSAASTAFMCVVAAAFGYLAMNETVSIHMTITPLQMFLWLTCSGMIGVVFTVLFRRHFLDDPKMVFADGVAAAETIVVLDSSPREAGAKIAALGAASLASAVVSWLRDAWHLIPVTYLSAGLQSFRAGIDWGLLNMGTGLLVGLNMGLSMLLGTLVVAYGIGPWLLSSGVGLEIVQGQIAPQHWAECQRLVAIASPAAQEARFVADHCGPLQAYSAGRLFNTVMLWAMWPATGLMVASAMTAVALKWRSIAQTFRHLRMQQGAKGEDMSLRAVFAWAAVLTVALAIIQRISFGMSVTQTVVAVAASLPLMLVGIRVLGETNQGPVSAMANALQAVFAVLWPQHIGLNLIAAGMAGNTSAQSEGMIQDYRTGRIVGSTPRILTYVQLAAVPIGAAAVAIMYPLLVARYGLGGDGLTAPTGVKLANMAVLLSKGVEALPRHALMATLIAAVVGIAVAVVKEKVDRPWVGWIPSVAGFGFALILPGELNIPIAIGGVAGWIWWRLHPASHARLAVTVASGFIAGEALIGGLLLPILSALNARLGGP